MYVCGVTPYDVGHLGHARTFVAFDTIRRYLEFNALEVRHIQNITDVDDDMIRKSRELGTTIEALTEQNHAIYLREMDTLNVERPEAFPTVTSCIGTIVEMVQELLDRGFAYEAEGGYVFFDTTRTPHFGVLAGLDREALRTFRNDSMPAEPEHLKRDSLDFLIWQPSDAPGATFESPWGPGRPGWHIECSAMAHTHLGNRIDIHGGGKDLAYPHHDSEIVQSESATGERPFSGWWLHAGTVQLDGVKMSKSLGNLVKVSDLLAEGHTPDAIRLYLLSQRYREDQDFKAAELDAWEERASSLRAALDQPGGEPDALRVQSYRNRFMDAMDDDFDTPAAIEILFEIAEGLESANLDATTAAPALIELAGVLGLTLGREG